MNDTQKIRELAIRLLDDENGINQSAFEYLNQCLLNVGAIDITQAIEASCGRYFLPEDHGLVA